MDAIKTVSVPLVTAAVVILAVCGFIFVTSDVRHFAIIVNECKEQGRIQNRDIRILCQVEERK